MMPMPCSPEITPSRLVPAHDTGHGFSRGLQHFIVVGVDGDVGSAHCRRRRACCRATQTRPLAPSGESLTDSRSGWKAAPAKIFGQRLLELGLPARTQAVILQLGEQRPAVQPAPCQSSRTSATSARACCCAVFQQFGAGDVAGIVALARGQIRCLKKPLSSSQSLSLFAQRQLDIDTLDAIGVLGHARQQNHHVFD